MFKPKRIGHFKNISKKSLISFLFFSTLCSIGVVSNKPILAGIDFLWDPDPNYQKLKYVQTSSIKRERSTYFLFLRPRDRKTGILKLSIKVPDYFEAKIKPEKVKFCLAKVGGYSSRSKCLKDIPSVIEISKDQTSIDIFPDNPIPVDKNTYALKMKIFNPRKVGMFQFHAYAQSPGALPISGYVGTWNIDVSSD